MNRLFIITLLLIIASISGLSVANRLLKKYSYDVLEEIIRSAEAEGIRITQVQFDDAHITSFNAVAWENLSFNVGIQEQGLFVDERAFSIRADRVILHLDHFLARQFFLDLQNLQAVLFSSWREQVKGLETREVDRVTGDLRFSFTIDTINPQRIFEHVKNRFLEVMRLFTDGHTKEQVTFSGRCHFSLNKSILDVTLETVGDGTESRLVMRPEDIKQFSDILDETLTAPETELLAQNPLRVPRLLRIRDFAEQTSETVHQQDRRVSKDAYRHVLWSYLLTRTYGEDFAKQVTDAHETETAEPDEAERIMDLKNNEIGRRYALQDQASAGVLRRFLNDKEVIQSPQEAFSRRSHV